VIPTNPNIICVVSADRLIFFLIKYSFLVFPYSVSTESKEWVENPANRLCDAPGSWFCPGQYPPPLKKILASKKDFQQLEDFNKNTGGGDDEYTKQYFDNLLGENKGLGNRPKDSGDKPPKPVKLSPEEIDVINENWENNEITSKLWEAIAGNHYDDLKTALKASPQIAHLRSQDGRGPMWWAHEYGNKKMVDLFKKYKVSETRTDAKGLTPLDISKLK
jgi:dolichyl-diphosphooligosaccharide---protein glycosyltransferase